MNACWWRCAHANGRKNWENSSLQPTTSSLWMCRLLSTKQPKLIYFIYITLIFIYLYESITAGFDIKSLKCIYCQHLAIIILSQSFSWEIQSAVTTLSNWREQKEKKKKRRENLAVKYEIWNATHLSWKCIELIGVAVVSKQLMMIFFFSQKKKMSRSVHGFIFTLTVFQ